MTTRKHRTRHSLADKRSSRRLVLLGILFGAIVSCEGERGARTITGRATSALGPDPFAGGTILPAQEVVPNEISSPVEGVFSVDVDGQATYSIPIWTPPGRNGVGASLALSYRSNGSNGPLGVGWSLAGLSEIARCKKNIRYDGAPEGIDFVEDAFCLDGGRLVSVGPNEFRTATNTFVRVKTDNSAAPTYFTLETRDGLKYTYGKGNATLGARRVAPVASPTGLGTDETFPEAGRRDISWALSRLEDSFGNYVTYSYARTDGEPSEGHWVERTLSTIAYTAHADGTPATRLVTFVNEVRPDIRHRYVSGVKVRESLRLARIEVRGPGLTTSGSTAQELLKQYRLEYSVGIVTRRSRLTKVWECDGSEEPPVCRPPHVFEWSASSDAPSFAAPFDLGPGIGTSDLANLKQTAGAADATRNFWGLFVGDFNADGRDDLMYRIAQAANNPNDTESPYETVTFRWYMRLSSGFGLLPEQFLPIPGEERIRNVSNGDIRYTGALSEDPRLIDGDGDGDVDIVKYHGAEGWSAPPERQVPHWSMWRTNWTSSTPSMENFGGDWSGIEITDTDGIRPRVPVIHIGDINGDSLPDLVRPYKDDSHEWVYRKNLGGFQFDPTFTQPFLIGGKPVLATNDLAGFMVDSDGDGAAEFTVRSIPQPAEVQGEPGACDGAVVRYRHLSLRGSVTTKRDSVLSGRPAYGCATSLNGALYPYYHHRWFLDVNGDGLPDSVAVRADWQVTSGGSVAYPDGDPLVSLNTGNGYGSTTLVDLPGLHEISPTRYKGRGLDNGVRIGDFDGDGNADLLLTDNGGSKNNAFEPADPPRQNMVVLRWNGTTLEPWDLPVPTSESAGFDGNGYGDRLTQVLDANGDGLLDILMSRRSPLNGYLYHAYLYLRTGGKPDTITKFRGGYGAREVAVTYAPVSDPNVYTPPKQERCLFPLQCLKGGMWVVASVSRPDGLGGTRQTRYDYEAGFTDRLGSGFLGFGNRTETDVSTTATTDTRYDNDRLIFNRFLRARLPETIETTIRLEDGSVQRSFVTHSYQDSDSDGAPRSYLAGTSSIATETRAGVVKHLSKATMTRAEDGYGGVTSTASTVYEISTAGALTGRSTTTTANYSGVVNDTSNWLLGRWTSSEVQTVGLDARSVVRNQAVTYDRGTVQSVRVMPSGGSDVELSTVFERNTHGQVSKTTLTGADYAPDPQGARGSTVAVSVSRIRTLEFDALDGTYVESVSDQLSTNAALTYSYVYHSGYGVLASATYPNGLSEYHQYDTFGRPRATRDTSGVDTRFYYERVAGREVIRELMDGRAATRTYLDFLGRPWKNTMLGFDGQLLSAELTYDHLGRVVASTEPHLSTEAARTTTYAYDLLGRPTQSTKPDGTSIQAAYDALKTKSWDEKSLYSYSISNGLGQVVEAGEVLPASMPPSEDGEVPPQGGPFVVKYTYAPGGERESDIDAAGRTAVTRTYDALGRLVAVTDVSSGDKTLRYNAFGQLREQTDSRGTTRLFYDALGRLISRQDRDGTSTLTWDEAENGFGALASATSADGVVTSYEYDSQGRTRQTDMQVNGATYTVNTEYDDYGRPAALTYPQVGGQARLQVKYGYTAQGDLERIYSLVGGTQHVYWQAEARDSSGRLTRERFANGVGTEYRYDRVGRLRFQETLTSGGIPLQRLAWDYEANGNLSQRNDLLARRTELYLYDGINRLWRWKARTACQRNTTQYEYSSSGNLTARQLIVGSGNAMTYTYQPADGSKPYAVSSAQVGSGTPEACAYDTVGNQTAGGGRSNGVFGETGLPRQITATGTDISFKYDAFGSRVFKASGISSTTTYVANLYEKRTGPAGITHVFYVTGGGGPVAQVEWNEVGGSVTSTSERFLHRDELGSIETVTDAAQNVAERLKFDPWGERRDPANVMAAVSHGNIGVRLGFTGHEHDDDMRAINMKGRIFDATLARFLSPDVLNSDPLSSQGNNRYAYVLNRPTTLVDPSGFAAEGGWESDVQKVEACNETYGCTVAVGENAFPEWGSGEVNAEVSNNNLEYYRQSKNTGPNRDWEAPFSAGAADQNGSRAAGAGTGSGGAAPGSPGSGGYSPYAFSADRLSMPNGLYLGHIPIRFTEADADWLQSALNKLAFLPSFGAFSFLNSAVAYGRGDTEGALTLAAEGGVGFLFAGAGVAFAAAKQSMTFAARLARLSKIRPLGDQAHHMFPRALKSYWRKMGIAWDNARHGAWWQTALHQREKIRYNEAWLNWLRSQERIYGAIEKIPVAEAEAFARVLAARYGLTIFF